ncbi:MAG: AAA family ATPase [Actinomycetota bacterium]
MSQRPHPLLGRRAEAAVVTSAAASVQRQGAALVAVVGEPGVGKTSVLGEAVAILEGRGFRTMRVALSEVEAHLTWAGMRLLCGDVTEQELDELPEGPSRALRSVTGRGDPSGVDASMVAFALAEVVGRRAAHQPLLLVVDDLHWLDRATAGALAFAIRSSATAPVLTLVAHRAVALAMEPDRLLAADRTWRIEVPGLSVASVHSLLRDRAGVRLGRPDVLRVHAATGGHPLHTLEIGRLIAAGASLEEALVHPSAYSLIGARIESLPGDTRTVLLAAAIATQPSLDRIRRALPGRDVESELSVAVRQQLVDVRGGAVVFAHPLGRSAVVAAATRAERRAMELALAETADDGDERVALLVAAADRPDAALAADLDEAVERCVDRGDLQGALELAQRAVALTPETAVADRIERLLTAADVATAAGDLVQPVLLAEAAESLSDDVEVHFRAGVLKVLAVGNAGDHDRAAAFITALLPQLAQHPAKRARLHDLRSQLMASFDAVEAETAATAAVAAAAETGDEALIVRETAQLMMRRVLAGRPVDLDEVERIAATLPFDSVTKDWLADVLTFCDRSEAALQISLVQLEEYQRSGQVHFEAPVRSRIVGDLIALGRYEQALQQADAWFDLQVMIHGVSAAPSRSDVAYALALRGEVERALHDIVAAEQEAITPINKLDVASRACELFGLLERWADAADRAEVARALAASISVGALGVLPFRAVGVEALVNLRCLDEAHDHAVELEAIAAANREPRGPGEVARARAVLAAAAGDQPAAAAHWRSAVEVFAAIGLPLERGRCEFGLGAALRRQGKRAEAAQWLNTARETFEALGVPLLLSRVDAEIQRLGVQRAASANDLTPTEQQIVDLVVAGRSNAEIATALVVSLRTVESNLTRVYRKLGVKSRTALAAASRGSAS